MRSAALNLTWEVLARHRVTIAVLGTALAGAAMFAMWRGAPGGGRADPFADVLVLGMVLSMLFVFGIFNHTHLDRRSGQTGFPNRLFTYPVSTRLLVTVPMACGLVAAVVAYLAWVELVLAPLGRTLPHTWPALVLATAMAWYQATLWSLAAFRVARMLALCVLGTTLITIALLPAVDPSGVWFPGLALTSLMVLLIVAAYAVSLVSVKRQRHAGGHGAGLRFIIERLVDAIPSRSKPFRSAAHAQFWLESQRTGMLLPAGTLLVMLFVLFVAALTGQSSAGTTVVTLSIIGLTPISLAMLSGSVSAIPMLTAPDASLSPYLATRPISCGDMIVAKLQAAALAAALAWLIVLVLTPLWLIVWCDTSSLLIAWQHVSEAFPGRRRWMMLVMLMITVWLITFRMSVVNLFIGVAGRPLLLTGYVITSIAIQVTAVTLLTASLFATGTGGFASGAIARNATALVCLMELALLAKVVIAVKSGADALERGVVTSRSVVIYQAAWIGSTALVVMTFYLTAAGLEARYLPESPWLKMMAALAGLLVMPLARVSLAPHALASNRHR